LLAKHGRLNRPNRTKQEHTQRTAHNKLTRWKPKREMGRPQAPTTSSSSASATSAGGGGKVPSGSRGVGGCGSLEVVTEDEEDGGLRSSASVAMADQRARLKDSMDSGRYGLSKAVLDDDAPPRDLLLLLGPGRQTDGPPSTPNCDCLCRKINRVLVWACQCGLGHD